MNQTKMTLQARIDTLTALGNELQNTYSQEILSVMGDAERSNPWFTESNIRNAVEAIRDQFLQKEALYYLVQKYHLDDKVIPKKIGLILAGNIPFVGFHDILCCFLTGHTCLIKYSEKDNILIPYLLKKCIAINNDAAPYFIAVEKLKDYAAAIATGSNSTATHFKYYLGHVPHIIRQNRNSIAVLSGHESPQQLHELGKDIFSYFGLGCRNVSKIFLPENYPVKKLFDAFEAYSDIINHNKYKNNYDYNVALNLLNKENFLQNDMVILVESDKIISRIGSIHYSYYSDILSVAGWIQEHQHEIQCVVGSIQIPGIETLPFGDAQCPAIDIYADGVDTIQFLLSV